MNVREDNKQPQDWAKGEVASFHWLHEDTAREIRSWLINRKDKGGKQERVVLFEVQGKACPCLIVERTTDKGGYFRIVRLTEDKGTGFRVVGVNNLKGSSYLPADATQIRWIHSNLAGRWIGSQDREAFEHVLRELSHRGLHISSK